MKINLYATSPSPLLTEDGRTMTLPSGYTECDVTCDVIKQEEASDILVIRKCIGFPDGEYESISRLNSGRLFRLLNFSVAFSETVFKFKVSPSSPPSILFATGLSIFDDSRQAGQFCLLRGTDEPSLLCKLHLKYFTGKLDVGVEISESGSVRQVFGIIRANTSITTSEPHTIIGHATPLYFQIPTEKLLWNNSAVIATEDGQQYWAENGVPILERWTKVT